VVGTSGIEDEAVTLAKLGGDVRLALEKVNNSLKGVYGDNLIAEWRNGYYNTDSGNWRAGTYYTTNALLFDYLPSQIIYNDIFTSDAAHNIVSLWNETTYVGYYRNGTYYLPNGESTNSITFDTIYVMLYEQTTDHTSFVINGLFKSTENIEEYITKDTTFEVYPDTNFIRMGISGYLDVNGKRKAASSPEWVISDFIPINPGVTISYALYGQASTTSAIAYYQSNSESSFVQSIVFDSTETREGQAVVPQNVRYVRVCNNAYRNPSGFASYVQDKTLNQVVEIVKELATNNNGSYWTGKTIAFLGDSITKGLYTAVGSSTPSEQAERPYPSIVAATLDATCLNYGVSGTSISATTNTMPTQCFIARVNAMQANCDLIVVLGGTNDYATSVPLGTLEDTTDISFYGAVNVLCNKLIAKYPSSRIVFITPLLRDYQSRGEGTNNMGYTLEDIREAIYEVASGRYGLMVLDGKKIGLSPYNTTWRATYICDGLHPNPIGHELIGKNIARMLNGV
jgi:lysophospholipase L1-like esterase